MCTDAYGDGENLIPHPSSGMVKNVAFGINLNEKSTCRYFGLWSRLTADEVQAGAVYHLKVYEPKVYEPKVYEPEGIRTKVYDLKI